MGGGKRKPRKIHEVSTWEIMWPWLCWGLQKLCSSSFLHCHTICSYLHSLCYTFTILPGFKDMYLNSVVCLRKRGLECLTSKPWSSQSGLFHSHLALVNTQYSETCTSEACSRYTFNGQTDVVLKSSIYAFLALQLWSTCFSDLRFCSAGIKGIFDGKRFINAMTEILRKKKRPLWNEHQK